MAWPRKTAATKRTDIRVWPRFMQYQYILIKTHDSESRGQEEAAIIRETKITRPLSELFTRKTAKKIANALAKLP